MRAYASMLMPDTPAEVREQVAEVRGLGFTAVKLGWGPLGQSPANDIALATAACEAAGDNVAIMIDAGFAYGADPARQFPLRGSSRTSACTGSRSRSSPTRSLRTPSSPMPSSCGSQRASRTRRSGASAI